MNILGPSDSPTAKHETGEGVENEERLKRKILIVEDDESWSRTYRMLMERLGYEVFIATNGKEALELVSTQNPDLVTMDGELVKKDSEGKEIGRDWDPDVAAKIRAQNSKVIITMISGHDLKFEGRGINKSGAYGETLKAHIESLLAETK